METLNLLNTDRIYILKQEHLMSKTSWNTVATKSLPKAAELLNEAMQNAIERGNDIRVLSSRCFECADDTGLAVRYSIDEVTIV